MVEAGKATPGQAVSQKLGPMGIKISDVMNKVNEKTASFKGMQVPVKLKVDTKTKEVNIEVGTPPTTQLIKKELKLEKGSGQPDKEKVANISIEQCIKIAKMKIENMHTEKLKQAVKSVVGSCNSLGVLIEGKIAPETEKDIEDGKYNKEILEERTETPEEKKKILAEQLIEMQKELKKRAEKLKATLAEATPKVEEKKEEEKKEVKEEKPKETKEEKKK